jgi:hypothetical protein
LGSRVRYPCSLAQAVFLSPTVSDLSRVDRSIDEFVVTTTSEFTHGAQILSLLSGDAVSVTRSNRAHLAEVSAVLGNSELEKLLLFDDITASNVAGRILANTRRGSESDVSGEISFVQSHLTDVPLEDLKALGVGVLELVFAGGVIVSSEDWLFEMITSLGTEFEGLMRFVKCEFLSAKGLPDYLEAVWSLGIDCCIWESICCPLHAASGLLRESWHKGSLKIIESRRSPFDGILAAAAPGIRTQKV